MSKVPLGDANKLGELTGLKKESAELCYKHNNHDLACSLASFVQSQQHLNPESNYFSNKEASKKHAKEINSILRNCYDIVQKVREGARIESGLAWRACALARWKASDAHNEASVLAAQASNASPSSSSSGGARIVYAKTAQERNTGCFLDIPEFWEKEIETGCNLVRPANMDMDRGYLKVNRHNLRERLLRWVEKSGKFHEGDLPFVPITDPDENTVRVIIMDSQRTFFEDVHRKKLTEFIYSFSQELKSYGQAMSYLAAVCLLVLNETETARILRMVGKDYIKGHWATEARGFATNAWLIEHFMQKRVPKVAKHMMKHNWWPDMYMQKIISGLCIHVLPYKYMFDYLDKFMDRGFPWLVQFMLAIVEHHADKLLQYDSPMDANSVFELMRMDPKLVENSDIEAVFARADGLKQWVDEQLAEQDLSILRMQIFDSKLAKRLEAGQGETFEPCHDCDKEKIVWWCETCEVSLCEKCKNKSHVDHEIEKF